MSNLNELIQYEAGIYQLETTDPVLGGPDGIDNLQGKQLANRTAYLKKHVDDLESGATVPPGIATQNYVQGELNKRDNKQSVRLATTGNIALNAVQVIDGVNVQVGDRVLVKNQVDATQNGIYVVAAGGWTRAVDADENVDVTAGMEVMASEGALQADTVWKLTTADPINLGVSLLSFADITTGYAPLNSPNLAGNPSAPTPAQFDNDTSLATTEFVQRALGNLQGFKLVTVNTALAEADAGKAIGVGASGLSIGLPPVANLRPGCALLFSVNSPTIITTPGAEQIGVGALAMADSVTISSFALFVWRGDIWQIMLGAQADASGPLWTTSSVQSGYQKLPSGVILQWGLTGVIASGVSGNTAFPITFPIACFTVVASFSNSGGGQLGNPFNVQGASNNSSFAILNGGAGAAQYSWFAVGH